MANENQFAEFFKSFGDFKAPEFDFSNALAAQKRNVEAVTAANQALIKGSQEIMQLQTNLLRKNIEESLSASKEAFSGKAPETNTAKQAELAKEMFESAVNNTRQIAELASKSGNEAAEILSTRASESFEEMAKTAA